MSREETIVLVDDLDGSEPAKKRTFGVDGFNYEIDLSEDNCKLLDEIFAQFIPSARKLPKVKRTATKAKPRKKPTLTLELD